MTDREEFEAWISAPPHEMPLRVWNGQYVNPTVQLSWCAWQERAKKVDTLEERLREFRNAQKPLPADFAKVLNDNLWDLYRSEEKPE